MGAAPSPRSTQQLIGYAPRTFCGPFKMRHPHPTELIAGSKENVGHMPTLADFAVEELLWKAGRHLSDQPTDVRLELRVQVKGAVDEQAIDGLIECLGREQTAFTRKQKNTNTTHWGMIFNFQYLTQL